MPTKAVKVPSKLRFNGRLSGSRASSFTCSWIIRFSASPRPSVTVALSTMARLPIFADSGINVERHAYCLCFHVRPATIFVALVNLGGSLACACLTLLFMLNHDSKSSYLASRLVRDELSRVTGISVLMYLLLTLVSAMLLYGVIKSKPSYILPFFGIQFIDYLFTMPQFLASVYTHPQHNYYMNKAREQMDMNDLKSSIGPDMYPRGGTWGHNPPAMATTSMLFMTLILIFKTYFIVVVWRCYRWLHMREFILPLTLNGGRFAADTMMTPIVITQGNTPPPNYEEATKMPEYKPPEYRTVVQAEPTVVNVAESSTSAVEPASVRGKPQGSSMEVV